MMAELVLAKDQERRLKAGHCWIYSNEVDTARSPLKQFAPGDPVTVVGQRGQWLGWGYVNPHSLICARLLSTRKDRPVNRELIVERVRAALELRERLFTAPYYRLCYGEADGLPGLVVDRYADVLVVQLNTAGMERMKDDVLAALAEVTAPRGVLLRSDSAARALEGLPAVIEVAAGEVPEHVDVLEGGSAFTVSARTGQKTGWFFDQAANRDRLLKYVNGRRVLDVFSYVGAWGIRAAVHGAAAVTCVDSSAAALDAVAANAARNGVGDRVGVRRGDAFDVLGELAAEGAKYDVVVLDPPAFVKRKKDLREGAGAYQRLNQHALELLAPGGVLCTASCSFHMPRDEFLRSVQRGARGARRQLQLLEEGRQGADHPEHPAIPETGYLKAFYLRALERF